ncbi:MAG TPA: hypothetical protein VK607_18890, partial [Kofleriaceae bacterium]|nr:hypothetical protein [Kofleriaceae bacterium]
MMILIDESFRGARRLDPRCRGRVIEQREPDAVGVKQAWTAIHHERRELALAPRRCDLACKLAKTGHRGHTRPGTCGLNYRRLHKSMPWCCDTITT